MSATFTPALLLLIGFWLAALLMLFIAASHLLTGLHTR